MYEVKIIDNLDVDEYIDLRRRVGWATKNPEIIEMAINSSTIVKKAVVDGRTVGMARAIGDGMSYLLVDVVVSPKYQKKGIGKKLVGAVIEEVKEHTIAGEYSTINLISISGAEKFYESCGFKTVPYDYNGNGMRLKVEK